MVSGVRRQSINRKRKGRTSRLSLASQVQSERRAVLARLAAIDRDRSPRTTEALEGDNTPTSEVMETVQESVVNAITLTSRKVFLARLRALDEAQRKIREGTYGHCDVCGRPIPPARLAAMPEATRCVPCADRETSSTPNH